MKKLYAILFAFAITAIQLNAQETIFSYTGAAETYVVPPGVGYIQIEVWGAQGGDSEVCGGITEADGGLGGYAVGNLLVTPGEVYTLYIGGKPSVTLGVGSAGGFNGGGASGQYGGAGGGATDVRHGGIALANRIIVAGGGGGGNTGCPDHGTGGAGGGYTGSNGINLSGGYAAGMGGTAVAGGAGGGAGSAGSLGVGGTGDYHVAGGGGGYYGGGGAYAAGGGGGSSYTGGVLDGSTTGGLRTGNGQIIITELCNALTVTISEPTICFGDSVTLEAVSESGATIIWSDGVMNGVPFTPDEYGYLTYTAVSSDGDDCGAEAVILVLPPPNVIAHVDEALICEGMEVVLYGTGAASYVWDIPGVIDDEPFSPPLGLSTYIVTGTTGLGCVNSDTITLEVFPSPTVTGSADDLSICFGESVVLTGSGADSYTWSPAAVLDGVAYTPMVSGLLTFTVTGANEFGCEDTDDLTIDVNEELIITYTTVDEGLGGDGSIDITVTGGTPAYSFDWDNDGTGDYDDTEDLSGLAGGSYTVSVKDSKNCTVSENIVISTQLSIAESTELLASVYPNPTVSIVYIFYPGTFGYEILTLDGKILTTGSATNTSIVSFEDFSTGTYLVRISTGNSQELVKVVKN